MSDFELYLCTLYKVCGCVGVFIVWEVHDCMHVHCRLILMIQEMVAKYDVLGVVW